MMHIHTMTTMLQTRLYVYSILCWVLFALAAIGSERDTEKPDAMSVETETVVKELENGEKIELCVWKYYDQNQTLCKIAVQQMNSTPETYWITELEINFFRENPDGSINFFSVAFLGSPLLCIIRAQGDEYCKSDYILATEKNEFIVRETMKHYMSQEFPPDCMTIDVTLTKNNRKEGCCRMGTPDGIFFDTGIQYIKAIP